MADPHPIPKFDAELVGAVRRLDEFVLVNAEQLVEQDELGDRRFADADRADLFGLHQLDREAGHLADDSGHRRRRHPAGGAAADDHDLADQIVPHAPNPLAKANGASAWGCGGAQQRATNSAWVGIAWAVSR